MALLNVSPPPREIDLLGADIDRKRLTLEAVWEITALCDTLRNSVTPDESQEWLVVRGLALRIESLAETVLSAVDDEHEETSKLWKTVTGDSYKAKA